MDINVIITLSSVLATLLVGINIYNLIVKKPQEAQAQNNREVERILNEFIIAQSKEFTALKKDVDALSKDVEFLKAESKIQNSAIDEISRDFLKHELTTTEREVQKK